MLSTIGGQIQLIQPSKVHKVPGHGNLLVSIRSQALTIKHECASAHAWPSPESDQPRKSAVDLMSTLTLWLLSLQRAACPWNQPLIWLGKMAAWQCALGGRDARGNFLVADHLRADECAHDPPLRMAGGAPAQGRDAEAPCSSATGAQL